MARPKPFKYSEYVKYLEKDINKKTLDVIDNELSKEAKKSMKRVIKQRVYDHYTPVQYERRNDNKGLLDEKNMITTLRKRKNQLSITNVAKPVALKEEGKPYPMNSAKIRDKNTRDLLYYWKDQGLVPNIFDSDSYKKWGRPMEFKRYIKEDLIDSGKSESIVVKGLKKRYKKYTK